MDPINKITINLGHVQTENRGGAGKATAKKTPLSSTRDTRCLKASDHEKIIFELMECMQEKIDKRNLVLNFINKEKQLLYFDLPQENRVMLFQRLNLLTQNLMIQYIQDKEIFSNCFEMITLLKNQIDRNPQQDLNKMENEWEELEKSVYLLCDWEDHAKAAAETQTQANLQLTRP